MEKKSILVVSILGLVFGYVLTNPVQFHFCKNTYTFNGNVGCLDSFVPTLGEFALLFSLPILLFSLITYRMRDSVFRAWATFAAVWVPISSVLLILIGLADGGGSMGIPNVLDQEFVAMILTSFFSFISLIIIGWKYFATRRA